MTRSGSRPRVRVRATLKSRFAESQVGQRRRFSAGEIIPGHKSVFLRVPLHALGIIVFPARLGPLLPLGFSTLRGSIKDPQHRSRWLVVYFLPPRFQVIFPCTFDVTLYTRVDFLLYFCLPPAARWF